MFRHISHPHTRGCAQRNQAPENPVVHGAVGVVLSPQAEHSASTIVVAATEQIRSYPLLSVAIRSSRNRLFPSVSVCFRCSPSAQTRARIPGTGIENGNKRFQPDTDTNGEKQITTDPLRSATNAVVYAPFNSRIQSRGPATIIVAATEQIRSSPLLSVVIRSSRNRLFPFFPRCFPSPQGALDYQAQG